MSERDKVKVVPKAPVSQPDAGAIDIDCPVIRLYFNSRAESPLVWSVDHGPGTPEVKSAEVRIAADGYTGIDPAADNVSSPGAWIEFHNAEMLIDEHTVYILKKNKG